MSVVEECVQEFVLLTSNKQIRNITLMKDDTSKTFYRRTTTERWIRCTPQYIEQIVKDQRRLINFMNKHKHLLNINIDDYIDTDNSGNGSNNGSSDESIDLP